MLSKTDVMQLGARALAVLDQAIASPQPAARVLETQVHFFREYITRGEAEKGVALGVIIGLEKQAKALGLASPPSQTRPYVKPPLRPDVHATIPPGSTLAELPTEPVPFRKPAVIAGAAVAALLLWWGLR